VDHDIIRVFREALRGPPGRQSRRAAFQVPDFWTSASKNLGHNKVARERSQIDDTARPVTKWGAFGKKLLPPHYWLEYLNCQDQRELDMLDILHISAGELNTCLLSFAPGQIRYGVFPALSHLNNSDFFPFSNPILLKISKARDAESHDSNFSSFYWNISQNPTKEKHRTGKFAIFHTAHMHHSI